MAVDWRYFWYMELSRRLHSRYRLVDYIWVKSQVCEHGTDSNNSIYSSFIGLRWSNNGRHCFKSYSEHVLASHNLLFCSDTHYLLHNTRILWTQIKISVKTTFSRLLCLTVARLSKVPPSSFRDNIDTRGHKKARKSLNKAVGPKDPPSRILPGSNTPEKVN